MPRTLTDNLRLSQVQAIFLIIVWDPEISPPITLFSRMRGPRIVTER